MVLRIGLIDQMRAKWANFSLNAYDQAPSMGKESASRLVAPRRPGSPRPAMAHHWSDLRPREMPGI